MGVTGSIAAYKAVELCRALKKEGANVQVILSEGAKNFVSALSFHAVSGKPVLENQFSHGPSKRAKNAKAAGGMRHIDLSNADALIVAPATANFVAKATAGLADDLLSTLLQAFSGPVLIAPAMNDIMYENQVLRRNVLRLRQIGYGLIEPDAGDLACGRKGQGRLASTEKILSRLSGFFAPQDLAGKTVLVTAGPTREYLDPVRFLSNASSGKMGFAVAAAAKARGASVRLVSGPVALEAPAGVAVTNVQTTTEMMTAAKKAFFKADVFISAAAPADFGPKTVSKRKIPKKSIRVMALAPTPDILRAMGKAKTKKQVVVGFALESPATMSKAMQKRRAKDADFIVLNGPKNLSGDFAAGTLVFATSRQRLARQTKEEFANALLDAVVDEMGKKEAQGN